MFIDFLIFNIISKHSKNLENTVRNRIDRKTLWLYVCIRENFKNNFAKLHTFEILEFGEETSKKSFKYVICIDQRWFKDVIQTTFF